MIHLRFPHSSLVALSAAYILLPTCPDDEHLSIVARNIESPVPRVSRTGIKSIAFGSFVVALSLIFCRTPWPRTGLFFGVVGGGISIIVGLGVTFGLLRFAEDHLDAVYEDQKEGLGRVLERYGLGLGGASGCREEVEAVWEVVDGKRESVEFETRYGALQTRRTKDGYMVKLDKGEKEIRQAEVVRGTDIGDGDWTQRARALVGSEWADLIDSCDRTRRS